MRRSFLRGSLVVAGVAMLAGCSISTSPNSVTFKTQTKFRPAQDVSVTATTAWNGKPIEIENGNGSVRVIGDPNATTVRVTTRPFAFADTQADGDAAVADVQTSIGIEERAENFYVHCGLASKAHGSAANGTTGCDDFTVVVPSGNATLGLTLKAVAKNGSMEASNLYAAAGQQPIIRSENGSVKVTGFVGSILATSGNGNVDVDITPTPAANITTETDNGDITLTLPAAFEADLLQFGGSTVNVSAFSDLTAASTSRGRNGVGAGTIRAVSQFGDVTLRAR